MRKVRILEARAGNADERYNLPDNFSFQPGTIEEFDDELAEAWIAAGIVEAVDDGNGSGRKSEPAKHEAHGKHEARPDPEPKHEAKPEKKPTVIRAHSHHHGSK